MNRNLTFINSTFVNLENLDRTWWITTGKVLSWISLILNALVFYLIVRKSKQEIRSYKIALVVSHALLCSAQFLWGVLMCMVPLLPFPAFIFYGHLASHADVFILIQLWIFLIISFLWALFATLVIRYRMVSSGISRGSFYWIVFATVSYLTCVTTVILMFEILRSSEEDTNAFIARVYPKYVHLASFDNLLILSSKPNLHISAFGCITIFGALTLCYLILSISIFVEVRKKVNSFSKQFRKHHLKVLRDIILQIITKLITFTFFPILTLSLYFVTPEFDAIVITMICYNIFVAAPIPGTLVVMAQTPSYRKAIVEMVVRSHAVSPVLPANHRATSNV